MQNYSGNSNMAEQTGALELLCSPAKILRDRGIIRLKENLQNTNTEGVKQLEVCIRLLLVAPDSTWERRHGALMGFKVYTFYILNIYYLIYFSDFLYMKNIYNI